MLGVWLAALLPTRRQAAVLASGGLIAAYVLNTLGATVPALDPWRPLSPLYWSDASLVLVGSFDALRLVALVVAPVVLGLLAHDAFRRREIGSGVAAWPWRWSTGRGSGTREGQ
jgi:hypothetical protein